jgi:hypothetical protein
MRSCDLAVWQSFDDMSRKTLTDWSKVIWYASWMEKRSWIAGQGRDWVQRHMFLFRPNGCTGNPGIGPECYTQQNGTRRRQHRNAPYG